MIQVRILGVHSKYGLAVSSVVAIASQVHGDRLGLHVVNMTNNDDGLLEFAVFARFDRPTDELLNIFDANIASATGLFHDTIDGSDASALLFTSSQAAMSDNPDADSVVTIGLVTGDGNNTLLDPNCDASACITGSDLGVNAGWLSFPTQDQGVPDAEGRVLIAVFAPLNDAFGTPGIVSGSLMLTYRDRFGTPQFGLASFATPSHGGLGLLALAGVIGPRRRRPGT
jgi:hypothetical protein